MRTSGKARCIAPQTTGSMGVTRSEVQSNSIDRFVNDPTNRIRPLSPTPATDSIIANTAPPDRIRRRDHRPAPSPRGRATPGEPTRRANGVGPAMFVAIDAVLGTLELGFAIQRGLTSPFHRAVFDPFLA